MAETLDAINILVLIGDATFFFLIYKDLLGEEGKGARTIHRRGLEDLLGKEDGADDEGDGAEQESQ